MAKRKSARVRIYESLVSGYLILEIASTPEERVNACSCSKDAHVSGLTVIGLTAIRDAITEHLESK